MGCTVKEGSWKVPYSLELQIPSTGMIHCTWKRLAVVVVSVLVALLMALSGVEIIEIASYHLVPLSLEDKRAEYMASLPA